MSRYDLLDLSKVPPPDTVDVPSFDAGFENWIADLAAQATAYGATYNVGTIRSDPLGWFCRVGAYRGEVLLRTRVNDGIKAVLLATAEKGDLDNVCADFNIVRRVIVPANPTTNTPAVMESDDSLRARRALAPEALSTAGSYGAYRFFAIEASAEISDVGVYGPEYDFVDPGQVVVCVLSSNGDGTPSPAALRAVSATLRAWESPDLPGWIHPAPSALDADNLRPDTDWVIVRAAEPLHYAVQATIEVPPGADADALRLASQARVQAYCALRQRIGGKVTRNGLIAAGSLMAADGSSPLVSFTLLQPAADVIATPLQAPSLVSLIRFAVVVAND